MSLEQERSDGDPTDDDELPSRPQQPAGAAPKRNLLFVVVLVGVVVVLYFVITSALSQSVFQITVDEAVRNPSKYAGKEIKLKGNVIPGSISPDGQRLDFRLGHSGEALNVSFSGARPDAFADCAEVVVTGTMTSEVSFEAVDMVATCPSKYDKLPQGCEVQPPKSLEAERRMRP